MAATETALGLPLAWRQGSKRGMSDALRPRLPCRCGQAWTQPWSDSGMPCVMVCSMAENVPGD